MLVVEAVVSSGPEGPLPGARATVQPLARSLAAMRATLESTTNAILAVGDRGEVTDVNDRFVAMWSVPPDVVESHDGERFQDWVGRSVADATAFCARVSSINASACASNDVLTLLDGRVVERHSTPQVVAGSTIGRVWSFGDITETLQTRQMLRQETELHAWLDQAGLALNSTLELPVVIEAATRASIAFTGARFGWFIPHPSLPEADLLTSRSSVGGPPLGQSIIAPDSCDALAKATSQWQRAFCCNDLQQDEAARLLFAVPEGPVGPGVARSLLVVPVATRPDKVLGALALEHPLPDGFADSVQRQIAALASHAAVAIDNARLYLQARKDSTERKLLANLQKSSAERLQVVWRRLMQAQEEERKRLGRELHDQVGANLTALDMGLELLRKQLPSPTGEAVDKRMRDLQDITRDTMTRVRAVLADLRPTALDELGLLPALRHQAEVLTARGDIRFSVAGSEPSPRLPPPSEIALYRIAQEAWANAMKHSGASSVALTLSQQGALVTMTIEDDGKGFEPADLPGGTASMGLTTMRERAESVGAVLEVGTAEGAGVLVHLSLTRAPPA